MTVRAGLLSLAALLLALPAAAAQDAVRARTHYIHHCTGCHLMDGRGVPSKGIPSMRNTLDRFLKVQGGREYIVQVPGVMNSPLNDGDIANLMNWLLPYVTADGQLQGMQPYSAEEIASLRKTRPVDVDGTRRHLVSGLRAAGIQIDE
ncbi:MAG: cytochrome c [Rubrivivax sp.]